MFCKKVSKKVCHNRLLSDEVPVYSNMKSVTQMEATENVLFNLLKLVKKNVANTRLCGLNEASATTKIR